MVTSIKPTEYAKDFPCVQYGKTASVFFTPPEQKGDGVPMCQVCFDVKAREMAMTMMKSFFGK